MPERAFRPRKILVATDFSEYAVAALRQGLNLAVQTGAKLTVLHVRESGTSGSEWMQFDASWRLPPAAVEKEERQRHRQAEQRLSAWLAPHRTAGSKLRSAVCAGAPFVEIIRLVLEEEHDLVLAGTRGLAAVKRFLVGSTAERLVRKCPCPVWIVKPGPQGPLRSILAAVDFTEASGKGLRLAAFLASLYSCPLTALYVFNFPAEKTDLLLPEEAAGTNLLQKRRATRRAAAQQLSHFVAHHVAGAVEVRERLGVGPPWRVITSAARQMNADLIVMGSVGRSGIPGFFIGNTAEKVLRLCDRSLLTVKPDDFISPVQTAP